jgi:hypothetical protein
MAATERWPPVYDAGELKEQIERLGRNGNLMEAFYGPKDHGGTICQGDIVKLSAPLPFIDEEGEGTIESDYTHWLVLGNTCDFVRDDADVRWSQIVPVVVVPDTAIQAEAFQSLRIFGTSRKFYLPPWDVAGRHHGIADLQSIALVDKRCLRSVKATVIARVSLYGWVLLHSCIVRFLGRDDGRFDD